MLKRASLAAAVSALVMTTGLGEGRAKTPPELGDVAWRRDYAAAQRESAKSGRPMLILFDEVPGCATCVRYGQAVLTHPLIVEAAETLFVPVAVYNNVGGPDRKVLRKYQEPTWNNPVVRIVAADEQPLSDRLAGRYDQASLVAAMRTALDRAGRPVPRYLSVLSDELSAHRTETALFAMHCFWTGEVCLGAVDGVVGTRTGWRDGREIVEVRYDPKRVGLDGLLGKARRCADHAYVPRPHVERARAVFGDRVGVGVEHRPSPKDDRYQLAHSALKRVPMTSLQAQRINADLGQRRDPTRWLSPRQQALAEKIRANPRRSWPRLTGDLRTDMRRVARVAS